MSPRFQHRLFLTSLPLIGTTNKDSRTRRHGENPRTQGWGWSTPPLYPMPQRPGHTELEGKKSSYTLNALLLCQARPHEDASPELPDLPVGREPKGNNHCGSLGRSLYSDLAPQGLQGKLQGSATGNQIVTECWRGLQHTGMSHRS